MPHTQFGDEFHKSIVDNLADGVYYVDRDRRITYWNRGAHRITGYTAGHVIGRRCYDNLLAHLDADGNELCRTMCPLASTMDDGTPREVQVWLRHRDGHRKPVRIRTNAIHRDGEVVGAVEVFSDDSAVLQAIADRDRARRDALTDPLTGLPNRRMFDAALEGRLENLVRYGWPFGLLVADLDHFKRVNDEHGHAFGDSVLVNVAATLHGGLRAGDLVARWGGEEFGILVEAADAATLRETAERLRVLVAQSEACSEDFVLRVTISLGGALATPEDTPESLFARADASVYAAKRGGRNRVAIEPEGEGAGASDRKRGHLQAAW